MHYDLKPLFYIKFLLCRKLRIPTTRESGRHLWLTTQVVVGSSLALHVSSSQHLFVSCFANTKNWYEIQISKMILTSMFSRTWSTWALNCGRYFHFCPSTVICSSGIGNMTKQGTCFFKVKSGTLFDNVLICDDPEYAKKLADETWGKQKDVRRLFVS